MAAKRKKRSPGKTERAERAKRADKQRRERAAGSVTRSFKALSAVGVIAAGLIAVSLNVLVARFYKRWDWTEAGLYTLSSATVQTLHSLHDPVQVIVLLSASNNLTQSVHHMLDAYRAETGELDTRFIDPDRNPAEFLAIQKKYGIQAGKTEDGRVVTDASIVIARGSRHWFVTTDDMMSYSDKSGKVRPKLEQALTEGIANVLDRDQAEICFTKGTEEISIEAAGPTGLAELHYRLQKGNYKVREVDTLAPSRGPRFRGCRVVVVAGPQKRVPARTAREVADYLGGGGNVMLLVNPVLDDDNKIRPSGLEPVAELGGIHFNNDFIIEQDASARLPSGLGANFFAVPKRHAITKALFDDDGKPRFRVLVEDAQSLKATTSGTPDALLASSPSAFSIDDLGPFVSEGKDVVKGPDNPSGPFTVAMASELPKPKGSKESHGPRLVVVGTVNIAWSQSWRDNTLLGDRLFVENAISWLAARPTLVSVPEKPSHDIGLSLTEDSIAKVRNYVLLYMPGAGLLLGLFILLRRRAAEKRSRRREDDEDDES